MSLYRYGNAVDTREKFGEDHYPELYLIPFVITVALSKQESGHVYGTDYDTCYGACIRDHLHVSDSARCHLLTIKYVTK